MSSIILLSAGLDSTVSLAQALREGEVKLCLTFDYGQRARLREIEASSKIARHYNIRHQVISLPFLKEITNTSLVNEEESVPVPCYDELDDKEKTAQTAAAVWVPNRNGIFINIAAGYAESMGARQVVTGFNAEEAKSFPDNSRDYLRSANKALSFSTMKGIRVVSYTLMLEKVDIIRLGRRLGAPFEYIWPCYHGGADLCGSCESCRRYQRALKAAGEL
ncbi:MAG: 7-cyano-7-deazaguanine synthase QueC [Desulfocucumaceae bacterium]